MQESGESLLRLIQNDSLFTLDIFVREVVQNSLDAACKNVNKVEMKFDIKSFDAKKFSEFTPEIKENVSRYYPRENKALVVRDLNTVGLTGPMHEDEIVGDDYGNLLKLVYNISKKQEQEGSGGSWGLGKTVYFRLGIGLVLYYSRILIGEGSYESRLVVSLIENEKSEKTLINQTVYNKYMGIAWWGDFYKNTESSCPLTDEQEIHRILNVFDVDPYFGQQTGTTIIIPFLNENGLLQNARGGLEFEGAPNYPWLSSVEQYLKFAIAKWYFPRLNVRFPDGSFATDENKMPTLRVHVNNEPVNVRRNMNQIFKIFTELYRERTEGLEALGIKSKPSFLDVKIRKEFESTVAGKLCLIKVNKSEIGMYPPINDASPYLYCSGRNVSENEGNPPIICFSRKPGMIVSYDVEGEWSYNIKPCDSDHFVLALFKANSENKLKEAIDLRGVKIKNLEGYLRAIECGDHTSWQDPPTKHIVYKIQKNVQNLIKKEYAEDKEKEEVITSNLVGRQIADILLPRTGFGKASSIHTKPQGKRINSSSPRASVNVEDYRLHGDSFEFKFYCKSPKNQKVFLLRFDVMSDGGPIKEEEWEKLFDMPFPLEINKLVLKEFKNKTKKLESLVNQEITNNCSLQGIDFTFLKSKKYGKIYGVRVEKAEKELIELTGKISVKCLDRTVQGEIRIVEENDEE